MSFDDNASQSVSSSPGGDPTTGTFVPMEPLSSFLGESPIGDWTLHLADSFDNGFNDQLLFFFASITITVPTLSFETQKQTNFSIYPTVVSDNLNINAKGNISFSTEIYNALGTKVWSSKKTNTTFIDVSSLEAGIYFISIFTEEKKHIRKILKI